MYVCMNVCVYVCMYVCMYGYVCIFCTHNILPEGLFGQFDQSYVCYEELPFHERYFRLLYGFETWFLTVGEERRLRKCENRVLKMYELNTAVRVM